MRKIKKHELKHPLQMFILYGGALIILTPILWMISTSLKSMSEIMGQTPHLIPKEFHFENYANAWKSAPFTRYLFNTLFITIFSVIGNVLTNSFVAYGFSKIDFSGKRFLFLLVLSTMMIPSFVTLIPQYIMFSKIGWVNTYLPMIIPTFLGNSFFIFLLRQFYNTIPETVIESAKVEGASHFQIWRSIAMPMIKPAHLTVSIFAFNGAWNDFLKPLLYLNDETKYTLQIGLQIFKEQSSSQWNYLMAGSLIVLVPTIIIFFIFQNRFIEGSNINNIGLK